MVNLSHSNTVVKSKIKKECKKKCKKTYFYCIFSHSAVNTLRVMGLSIIEVLAVGK